MSQANPSHKKPRKPKKFRAQLFADFLVQEFSPCKVADVGGGKGLVAYILQQQGFAATVIDPFEQELPYKYTSLDGKRIKVPPTASVPFVAKEFIPDMAEDFDLLVGMHAHGCMMAIIHAAATYNLPFAILPCCVIDEPIQVRGNVDWYESLDIYARYLGFVTKRHDLGFKGQATVLWAKPVK